MTSLLASKVRTIPETSRTEHEFLSLDVDISPLVHNEFLGKYKSRYGDIILRDALNLISSMGKRFVELEYDPENEETTIDIVIFDPYGAYPVLTLLLDHILNDVSSQFWKIYTVVDKKSMIDDEIKKGGLNISFSKRCRFIDKGDWNAAKYIYFDNNVFILLNHGLAKATDFINKMRQPYNMRADALTALHQTNYHNNMDLTVWGIPSEPTKTMKDVGDMTESCKNLMFYYPDLSIPVPNSRDD